MSGVSLDKAASRRQARVGAAAGQRDRLHNRERQMARLVEEQAVRIEQAAPGTVYAIKNTCSKGKYHSIIIFNQRRGAGADGSEKGEDDGGGGRAPAPPQQSKQQQVNLQKATPAVAKPKVPPSKSQQPPGQGKQQTQQR